MVVVKYATDELRRANFVGKSVGEVRDIVSEALNVPSEAAARINNNGNVGCDVTLKDGDVLEFVKPADAKGC